MERMNNIADTFAVLDVIFDELDAQNTDNKQQTD